MVRSSKVSFHITPEACIGAAVVLLAMPLPWVLAWFVAAAVHEICHCLMLRACKIPIERICIGLHGAQIYTDMLTDGKAVLCSLSGSAGGLLLLLFASYFPKLAICAFVQSAFNLLPVFPLDGGRALRSLIRMIFSQGFGDRIYTVIETSVLCTFLLLGFLGTFFWKLGVLPFAFAVFFLLHTKKIKIPCK